MGNGLGCMGNYIAEKYQENDMNNKIIEGGVATAKGMAVVGKALYKIAKPVIKYASIKAIQGIGYLCNQTVKMLSEGEGEAEEKDKKEDEKEDKTEKDQKIEQNNYNQNNQNNQNKQNYGLDLPDGGQLIFQQSVDYPTYESIDRIYKNNNNENNNNNNNDNNNNIMENNLNNDININNFQNQNNINIIYNNKYNNNQVKRPDYSAARGLDYSIIGEI